MEILTYGKYLPHQADCKNCLCGFRYVRGDLEPFHNGYIVRCPCCGYGKKIDREIWEEEYNMTDLWI